MQDETIERIAFGGFITTLTGIALLMGIDGVIFTGGITALGSIISYSIAKARNKSE